MRERARYIDLIERTAFAHGKMAFVAGPRQVGKTTLSRQILSRHGGGSYHNWDDRAFRKEWIRDPAALVPRRTGGENLVVFDELHKAPRWKSYLKGVFDTRGEDSRILVTGSARLDTFRRGGDSLLGRYFLFRLHPFSVGELGGTLVPPDALAKAVSRRLEPNARILHRLLAQGGFPEPYTKADARFLNLWQGTRTERLVREDLRDITRAHDLSLLATAAMLLPERVGSLFSIQSLAGDLEVSHPTARRWMEWFFQLYYAYSIAPHDRSVSRSIRKQPKIYLWDWAEVDDPAARFENLVAGHLLKAVHFWTDGGEGRFDLRYVRDKEKREVDFLVVRDGKPWMMVECKRSAGPASPNLVRFARALGPAIAVQVVEENGVQEWFPLDKGARGQLMSADAFLGLLP
jgi:uncharacterized protein